MGTSCGTGGGVHLSARKRLQRPADRKNHRQGAFGGDASAGDGLRKPGQGEKNCRAPGNAAVEQGSELDLSFDMIRL